VIMFKPGDGLCYQHPKIVYLRVIFSFPSLLELRLYWYSPDRFLNNARKLAYTTWIAFTSIRTVTRLQIANATLSLVLIKLDIGCNNRHLFVKFKEDRIT
jgi:hypothetical protein